MGQKSNVSIVIQIRIRNSMTTGTYSKKCCVVAFFFIYLFQSENVT